MGSLEIAAGTVQIEPRAGYLHVVHPGPLTSEDEVLRYAIALEREAATHRLNRALIDARQEMRGGEPPEVRLSLWRWLQSTSAFEAVALVMPDQLGETRVNMLAVSQRLLLRAFVDSAVALRWLSRASRSTSSMRASDSEPGRQRRTSSFPPAQTFGARTPPQGEPRAPRETGTGEEPPEGPLPPRKITRS